MKFCHILHPSPPLQYNENTDILIETWPHKTEVSFTVVAMDKGTPTRGTYANVTVEMSNTCLVDLQRVSVVVFYEKNIYIHLNFYSVNILTTKKNNINNS